MDDRGFKKEEEEFGRLTDYNGSVLNNSSRDSTASTNREIGSILFGRSQILGETSRDENSWAKEET